VFANDIPFAGLIEEDEGRGIFRVRRTTMTSPAILAAEHERIFATSWLYAGHESEIPNAGDYVRRNVAGRPLFMARGRDGMVRTFYNTCTHRGATICRQPAGNAKALQCFYHAWSFDLEGRLIGCPDEAAYGPAFDRVEHGLRAVAHCASYRGFVFICLAPDVQPLEAYLAGAKEYLDLIVDASETGFEIVHGSNEYTIRANWKLLCENSLDGYHALPTHETYFKYVAGIEAAAGRTIETSATGAGSSYLTGGAARDLGNGHAVTEKLAPWGRPLARWSPLFGAELEPEMNATRARIAQKFGEARAVRMCDNSRNLLIFPNLVVNDVMGLTVRAFRPITPGEMRVTAWQLAPRDESAQMRAKRLDSFLTFLGPGGFATPDDMEALESCQDGFLADGVEWSDLSRGMLREARPVDELQMRAFWRRWNTLIAAPVPAGAR
jgi:p-cumate 2,3-dioxygenase alpha subunit